LAAATAAARFFITARSSTGDTDDKTLDLPENQDIYYSRSKIEKIAFDKMNYT
jgi:hypothetical protein